MKQRFFWIAAGVLASAAAMGFATWSLPGGDGLTGPDNSTYASLRVTASHMPAPAAYVRYNCHGSLNTASCQSDAKTWAVGVQSYLVVPHDIPEADCRLMAMALRQGEGVKNDGTLYQRPDGRMNCDFSRYGIAHIAYPEKPDGYKISGPHVSEYIGSREEYEVSIRDTYVKQPVYGFLQLRARVDYGWNNKYGHGGVCFFNRYSGQWHLEKPCEMTWES